MTTTETAPRPAPADATAARMAELRERLPGLALDRANGVRGAEKTLADAEAELRSMEREAALAELAADEQRRRDQEERERAANAERGRLMVQLETDRAGRATAAVRWEAACAAFLDATTRLLAADDAVRHGEVALGGRAPGRSTVELVRDRINRTMREALGRGPELLAARAGMASLTDVFPDATSAPSPPAIDLEED